VLVNFVLAARAHDQTSTAVFVTFCSVIAVVLLWTRRAGKWLAGA
jgi:hypothetical protein